MTNERRGHIKSLCHQIEVEQDEMLLAQMVRELQELIREWLDELHQPPGTRQPQWPVLPIESKLDDRHHSEPSTHSGSSNYEKIVDDAVVLMHSDYASLQKLYPERGAGGELRLLAFRGFNPDAAAFWQWVRADSKCTCAMALRSHRRVVAPDIATCAFMLDSQDQQIYLGNGIHSGQSTPLIAPSGNIVGMISTYWRTPHQPSENDFRRFDVLAREAAALIQHGGRVSEH